MHLSYDGVGMGHLIGPGSSVDPPKERWWADGTRMCHICMSFSTLVLITPKKSWKHASSARGPQYIARIRAKERTLRSWDDDMMRRVEKRKGNCILLERTGPRVGPSLAFVETSSFPQERTTCSLFCNGRWTMCFIHVAFSRRGQRKLGR